MDQPYLIDVKRIFPGGVQQPIALRLRLLWPCRPFNWFRVSVVLRNGIRATWVKANVQQLAAVVLCANPILLETSPFRLDGKGFVVHRQLLSTMHSLAPLMPLLLECQGGCCQA